MHCLVSTVLLLALVVFNRCHCAVFYAVFYVVANTQMQDSLTTLQFHTQQQRRRHCLFRL